jgi:hypothetical protein
MSSSTQPSAETPHYPSILGAGLRLLATRPAARAGDQPQRSFRRDALALAARMDPPFQVLGQEFVPSRGPCLLLSNHYYRPGFDAWQRALAISAVVPVEVHWIITSALTYPGRLKNLVLGGLSRWYLARAAAVYGFFSMPPMPPDPRHAAARAAAVRRVVDYIRQTPNPVIGLSPEGRDFLECRLGWPPLGAGRFVLHLAKLGLKLVPLGVYEEGGGLWLHFGPAFELQAPAGLPPGEQDRWASRQVMEHLARLVPASLRGEFGGIHGRIDDEN